MLTRLATLCVLALPAMAAASDIPPGRGTTVVLKPGPDGITQPPVLTDFNFPGDADAFRVTLPKGRTFGGWLKTFCAIGQVTWFDARWRQLATSVQPDSDYSAWAEITAPYAGTYYLQVKDRTPPSKDCSEQPGYLVAAVPTCRAGRKTRCWINPGTSVYAAIWAPTDKDWYRLTITRAGTYTIAGYGDRSGQAWDTRGVIGLRRSDTSVITESGRDDSHLCFLGEACVRAKLEPGRYFVTIRMPETKHTVRYQLGVTRER